MELKDLRYFVRVAEELHFGRAAAQLGMTQPPLSQRINALEQELGVLLLERTSRRVALTDAGRLFLVEARKLLAQAQQAVETARRAQSGEIGEIAIGFSSSVPFTPDVVRALSAFREAYVMVRLKLVEMARDAQIEALGEERIDLGFVRGYDPPPLAASMMSKLLMNEPLIVAMRSDHPLARSDRLPTIADLRNEGFILYQRDLGGGFNDHIERMCASAGFAPLVVQEAMGLAMLLGLVAAGMGITILTDSLRVLHPDNVVFRQLDDPIAVSGLWLIRRSRLSTAAQHFVDLLDASASARLAS
jgi:DNA-binding transcriptional LysR family regulator